ncbi:hypothetical protein ASE48_13700 [Mycobacterium sp. Root265]|nr:hypothetical protein ASE48_13700 [Mycobacterium sp. Root265]
MGANLPSSQERLALLALLSLLALALFVSFPLLALPGLEAGLDLFPLLTCSVMAQKLFFLTAVHAAESAPAISIGHRAPSQP